MHHAGPYGSALIGRFFTDIVAATLEVSSVQRRDKYKPSEENFNRTEFGGSVRVADALVHITTVPSEDLMAKCRDNRKEGLNPVVIVRRDCIGYTHQIARQASIGNQIDIVDIEQFVCINLLKWSRFDSSQRTATLEKLVNAYNDIVDRCETDPSLRIVLA